jgi:microsomal dipeptidase-like Zn-dependent dipeptidase
VGFDIAGPDIFRPVAEELLSSGYAGEDIKKVLGGNFYRVAGEIWK